MRLSLRWMLALAAVVAVVGCVEKGGGRQDKKIDPAYIEAHLLTQAPEIENKVDADFEGKVVYLGNNVDVESVAPGGKVTINHFWKVLEAPGSEWKIFAHVKGKRPEDWMNVDYTDMRAGYPVSEWKAGDIIQDEQKFALKGDWKSPFAIVQVGIYPKGKHAITDRMTVTGKGANKERALEVVRLAVEGGPVDAPNRSYVIRRTISPVTIDGKADEADWHKAARTPDFKVMTGSPAMRGVTEARLLWDDRYLYVFVEAKDPDVYSRFTKRDDPIYKEDVIELFIDADRNRRGYVELQVNPNNTQFDSWMPRTRSWKPPKGEKAFRPDWNADGMITGVQIHGTLDNRSDTDTGWDAEIAIPLAAVKGLDETMKLNLPPHVGDQWRLNIVRADKPEKGRVAAAAWAQINYKEWHAIGKLLTVSFGDANGKVKTAAAPGKGVPGAQPLTTGPARRGVPVPLSKDSPLLKREALTPRPAPGVATKPLPNKRPLPKAPPAPADKK